MNMNTTRTNELRATHPLVLDDGQVASVTTTLDVSARIELRDLQQQGPEITGVIALIADLGFGTVEADLPLDVDTTLPNPIEVDFGAIPFPILGPIEVLGEISYDIPGRQVCVALTLAGVVTVAKTCAHF